MNIQTQYNQPTTKVSTQDKINTIYKRELRIAFIGAISIICLGIGVLFMVPFPGLLNIKIWGFPFPYWYQMTFNWLGMAFLAYIIAYFHNKNEEALKNIDLDKEE